MPATQPRLGFTVWFLGLLAASVATMAIHQALQWYDHPVAGMLVTADLEVSSVGMPTWDGMSQGLSFPDRVLAVDGVDLTRLRGRAGTTRWDEAVADAVLRGARGVHRRAFRTFIGRQGKFDLRIDRLEPATWWLYGGGLVFTGGLYVIAALTALSASPRGALARAFGRYALLASLFLFTFFDSQTSHSLVPLFHFAYGWAPIALVGLTLRLPDDVPIGRRFPALLTVLERAVGA